MNTRPHTPAALSLAARWLATLLVVYLGCYQLRGTTFPDGDSVLHRCYGSLLEARLFAPVARVESALIGKTVQVFGVEPRPE